MVWRGVFLMGEVGYWGSGWEGGRGFGDTLGCIAKGVCFFLAGWMCWGFGLQEGWGIAISVDVLFIKYFA